MADSEADDEADEGADEGADDEADHEADDEADPNFSSSAFGTRCRLATLRIPLAYPKRSRALATL